MLFWINFPPEFLAEVFGATADRLQVVEIVGRNAFEYSTEASHGEFRETVLRTGIVEMALKKPEQFTALMHTGLLGFFSLGRGFRKKVSNRLHAPILPTSLGLFDFGTNGGKPGHQVFVAAINAVDVPKN